MNWLKDNPRLFLHVRICSTVIRLLYFYLFQCHLQWLAEVVFTLRPKREVHATTLPRRSTLVRYQVSASYRSALHTVATSPLALRWMCDSPRTGSAWRITPIYVARTSINRVIMACDLYCYLAPQCEASRTCRTALRSQQYHPASSDHPLVHGKLFLSQDPVTPMIVVVARLSFDLAEQGQASLGKVQLYALTTLRNLMASHDADSRLRLPEVTYLRRQHRIHTVNCFQLNHVLNTREVLIVGLFKKVTSFLLFSVDIKYLCSVKDAQWLFPNISCSDRKSKSLADCFVKLRSVRFV